jgi:WD40 repeat protein
MIRWVLVVAGLFVALSATVYAQSEVAELVPITVENADDIELILERPDPTGNKSGFVVSDLAISPDGHQVAYLGSQSEVTDNPRAVIVQNIVTGRRRVYPFVGSISLTILMFLDSERLLVIRDYSSYEILRLFDGAIEFSTLLPLEAFGGWSAVVHLATGKVAIPIIGGEIDIFDLLTGERIGGVATTAETLGFYSLAFTEDGQFLAAGDGDGNVWVWDVQTFRLEIMVTPPPDNRFNLISALEFSPDGRTLAIGYGRLALWQVTTSFASDAQFTVLEGHTGNVTHLAFTQSGDVLLSMSGFIENSDSSLRAWDMRTGEQVYLYQAEMFGDFGAFVLSSDDRHIITTDLEATLRIFGVQG